MKLLTPVSLAAIACSREGWAIGEGLARFFEWVAITVATVLVLALASGIVIGTRKGKEKFWRQVGLHLAGGVIVLVVLAIAGVLFLEIEYTRAVDRGRREYAILDTWLAPIKAPVPGELDRALAAVADAEVAQAPGRRGQLISMLPDELGRIDWALNDKERSALSALAIRLRAENEQLGIRAHPESFDALDGTVAWQIEKPDRPAALRACTGRKTCTGAVMRDADGWCKRQVAACREAFTSERLAAVPDLGQPDQTAMWRLEVIQHRVRGNPSGQ
jgi:hypothetical protein